jgi:hypothetical protein
MSSTPVATARFLIAAEGRAPQHFVDGQVESLQVLPIQADNGLFASGFAGHFHLSSPLVFVHAHGYHFSEDFKEGAQVFGRDVCRQIVHMYFHMPSFPKAKSIKKR